MAYRGFSYNGHVPRVSKVAPRVPDEDAAGAGPTGRWCAAVGHGIKWDAGAVSQAENRVKFKYLIRL